MFLKTLLFSFIVLPVQAEIISMTVGQVSEHVVTSREVLANLYLDRKLFSGPKVPTNIKSKAFAKKVNAVLLEWVVYNEALNLQEPDKTINNKVSRYYRIAMSRVAHRPEFRRLEVSTDELKKILRRKLIAKDFIQFKASSSVVPITDSEAREYFNANPKKFGKSPFASLKANIKNYLNRKQVDERMKAWFEILQSKYKVKNIVL